MILFSLSWDTQKRSISLKWNRFLSLGLENGKVLMKILKIPIPFGFKQKRIQFLIRWVYLKEALSFLKKWKLKKMEGTFSLPDPMMNGLLYGWVSGLQTGKGDRKIHVTINFLGENRFSGEAVISPKAFFNHLKRWVLILFRERRRRRS